MRNWTRARGRFALIVLLLVLSLRLALPGGVMPRIEQGRIVAALCSGTALVSVPTSQPPEPEHPARDMPCAFAGLTLVGLDAGDPPVPVTVAVRGERVAIARRAQLGLARVPYLKPPSHGPPSAFST